MKKTIYLISTLLAWMLCHPTNLLAATITVNTTTDEVNTDGDCSLREAFISSNDNTATDACTAGEVVSDTIVVPTGIFVLSLTGSGEDESATGDLDITWSGATSSEFNLVGAGSANTIIDANGIDRVIGINSIRTVSINGITIKGGKTSDMGAGIFSEEAYLELSLDDVIVEENTVDGGSSTDVYGGGIYVIDDLKLTNSTVSNNTLTTDANVMRGGGIFCGGNLTMTDSKVEENSMSGDVTYGYGGGIDGDDINITDSTVSNNAISGVWVYAFGGGIHSMSGDVTMIRSTVSNNSAIAENLASGGGIYSAGLMLRNSTVSKNGVSVTDTTQKATGGGVFANSGVRLYNATIADNMADQGGGIYGNITTFLNSILADNIAASGGPDCYGYATGKPDHSLITDSTDCKVSSSGALISGDPHLKDLADNGGKTKTQALGRLSVAIDANKTGCVDQDGTLLTIDQRGFTRSSDCDIGAYEWAKPNIKINSPKTSSPVDATNKSHISIK